MFLLPVLTRQVMVVYIKLQLEAKNIIMKVNLIKYELNLSRPRFYSYIDNRIETICDLLDI